MLDTPTEESPLVMPPQTSTMAYVADLIIRRVLDEARPGTDVFTALEESYPFDNSPLAKRIWLDALLRYSLSPAVTKNQSHQRKSQRQ
jgi:hypothetical protein